MSAVGRSASTCSSIQQGGGPENSGWLRGGSFEVTGDRTDSEAISAVSYSSGDVTVDPDSASVHVVIRNAAPLSASSRISSILPVVWESEFSVTGSITPILKLHCASFLPALNLSISLLASSSCRSVSASFFSRVSM